MKRSLSTLIALIALISGLSLHAEILPPFGLYDPLTLRSTTTGDPYPVFPADANKIPPINLDRTDQVDNALTIVIQTLDVLHTYETASFDSLLYSTGIYPTGSMNEFFLESSYGQFGVQGEIAGWFTAENNYSYYTSGGNYGMGQYPNNAQRLVEEAVLAADIAGVDFSQFDNDGDGSVDALIIVHQGPGAEFTGSQNDIWSHRWSIDPILLDGVSVSDYSMDPELEGNGTSGDVEPIAVFAHEYTHLLGIPDLYDYDSKLVAATFTTWGDANDHPVNDWCIMGYAGYGLSSYGKGAVPPHHCAYFKVLLGWAEPIVLGTSATGIQVPQVEVNPVIYKIPINGSETEYFLVENRNSACPTTKFDHLDSDFSAWFSWFTPGQNPLDAGLVIYHIDEDMPLNNGTPQYAHYGCKVMDAGFSAAHPWPNLEFTEWWYPYEFQVGAAYSAEDAQSELTPNTDPNTDGYSAPSGIFFSNISNSGPLMTFDLSFTSGTPSLVFNGAQVVNDGGDNDQFLDAGEEGDIYITIRNSGSLEATGVTGTLSSTDPYLQVTSSTAAFPNIGCTLIAQNSAAFRVSVLPGCPAAYDAELNLIVSWNGGADAVTVPLEIGWDAVFSDNMEGVQTFWTHGVAFGSYNDQWHLSQQRNHTGNGHMSWKCGQNGYGSYWSRLNAALVSPQITLPSGSRIGFWHRLNCEPDWDGGIVEISAGTDWTQLTPTGGYPDQIQHSGSPFQIGTDCYSHNFNWTAAKVNLYSYSGDQQIRFRFGSDQGTEAEGWYIDDVCIYAPEGSVGVETPDPAAQPATFTLFPPHPNPFNAATVLSFSLPVESPTRLEIVDVSGRTVATLFDGPAEEGMHQVTFDAAGMASGVYFAVLSQEGNQQAQKLLYIK
ncbi:MAG: M6 family metalloprotease domain-containing protein [bacterium]|nr:M6 family metalloprotease domain-containing protein [bacterium]